MNRDTPRLFDDLPDAPMVATIEPPKARARVLMPNRLQLELRPSDLESLLPEGIERGSSGAMWSGRT